MAQTRYRLASVTHTPASPGLVQTRLSAVPTVRLSPASHSLGGAVCSSPGRLGGRWGDPRALQTKLPVSGFLSYLSKAKGVEGLIDIENPNRVAQTTKKVTQLDLDGPKELSRRER